MVLAVQDIPTSRREKIFAVQVEEEDEQSTI